MTGGVSTEGVVVEVDEKVSTVSAVVREGDCKVGGVGVLWRRVKRPPFPNGWRISEILFLYVSLVGLRLVAVSFVCCCSSLFVATVSRMTCCCFSVAAAEVDVSLLVVVVVVVAFGKFWNEFSDSVLFVGCDLWGNSQIDSLRRFTVVSEISSDQSTFNGTFFQNNVLKFSFFSRKHIWLM